MSSGDNGPVLRIMGRVNHIILLIEKTSLIILMVGMLIFGFLQVFSRFILKAPIGWSEELLTYSFTWASFMGASMAIYTNSHFSVDLVTKHFSQKLLKTVRLVIWVLICLFAVFLLYMGTRLAIANHIQRMPPPGFRPGQGSEVPDVGESGARNGQGGIPYPGRGHAEAEPEECDAGSDSFMGYGMPDPPPGDRSAKPPSHASSV